MTAIAAVLADADGWDGHMGWGGGWWMFVVGTVMMVGSVVLVVWLVRTTSGGADADGRARGQGEDPLASARRILAERYARGELSTEEYRERVDQM
ncbi:MAG: SHOCT domain-containing protein [Acidimicrobiia bacterium]|nr:SHOCT domain-containing protein [Acidimicrobiia bacterium]MDH5238582.1 SHOCT domain-containing protein [Acidimicrobiia bacterium]